MNTYIMKMGEREEQKQNKKMKVERQVVHESCHPDHKVISHLLEMAYQFGPELLLTAKTKEKKGSLSRFGVWKIKQMGYTEQV